MYDQFSGAAEGDFVRELRAAGGDNFAVATMRNHWEHYIPDAALDALAAFGVTHARIPVGYWLVEAPVVLVAVADGVPRGRTPSIYDFGLNHEGFVTGGINALEAMLAKLKARGIKALIDLHALPGGASSCQSYAGWQVNQPLFGTGTPPSTHATPVAGACGGAGPYNTSRGAAMTWMAVGEAGHCSRWPTGLLRSKPSRRCRASCQVSRSPTNLVLASTACKATLSACLPVSCPRCKPSSQPPTSTSLLIS